MPFLAGCEQQRKSSLMQSQVMEDKTKISTVEAAWEHLRSLPDPWAIQQRSEGKLKIEEEEQLFVGLAALTVVKPDLLDALYAKEGDHHRQGSDGGKVGNQLRILTRVLFQVEKLKERKRFPFVLDDGSRPTDWLWPLVKSDTGFKLQGRGISGYTGYWPSAYDEYEFVKKETERRSPSELNRNKQADTNGG